MPGKRKRRGLALVSILLMLSVLGLVAVLMASLGTQTQRLARAEIVSDQALYAGEAGLAVGTERYLRDATYTGTPLPAPFGQGGSTYQIALYTKDSPPPGGSLVPDKHVLVVATGQAINGTSRRVSALISQRAPMPTQDNAIYGGESVRVDGRIAFFNSLLPAMALDGGGDGGGGGGGGGDDDGDDGDGGDDGGAPVLAKSAPAPSMRKSYAMAKTSSPTAKSASAPAMAMSRSGTFDTGGSAHIAVGSTGDDALTLAMGSRVDGELRIPANSDASVVIQDDSGGQHQGVNSSYSPPAMVSVRLPLTPGDQDLNITGAGGGELAPGAYGHVVVDGGVLEINTQDLQNAAANGESPRDLYVFRSLTLKNGGQVLLKAAAADIDLTSTLYVDEKLEVVDGAFINETNKPARLQLYVMDSAPVDLSLNADSSMMLYAPGSEVFLSSGDMYGSILGQKVEIGPQAGVFFDQQLATTTPDPWGNGGFFAERKSYRRD